MPATRAGTEENESLLLAFVLFAGFHAFFHMVNSGIDGFNGCYAMPALVMLGFFQMMLGLLQGLKRSLHMRLIVIIACDGSDGNAKEAQNNCQGKQPGDFSHRKRPFPREEFVRSKTSLRERELSIKRESMRTTPFDMAAAMPEYALAIPHKAIACLYLGHFSADNHARILPPRPAI